MTKLTDTEWSLVQKLLAVKLPLFCKDRRLPKAIKGRAYREITEKEQKDLAVLSWKYRRQMKFTIEEQDYVRARLHNVDAGLFGSVGEAAS